MKNLYEPAFQNKAGVSYLGKLYNCVESSNSKQLSRQIIDFGIVVHTLFKHKPLKKVAASVAHVFVAFLPFLP